MYRPPHDGSHARCIDKQAGSPLEDHQDHNLPAFLGYSKSMMDIHPSKPLPPTPHHQDKIVQPFPEMGHYQHTYSELERRPSELSCPSLMCDSFSSTSDADCFESEHEYAVDEGSWEAYFSPGKEFSPSFGYTVRNSRPPSVVLDLAVPFERKRLSQSDLKRSPSVHLDPALPLRPKLRTQLSREHRNFATHNLPSLDPSPRLEYSSLMYNGDVSVPISKPKAPRPRANRAQTLLSPPPPPPPQNTPCISNSQAQKSTRPLRPRANTSPAKYAQMGPMSDHSGYPSTEGSPLYMMISAPTPPVPHLDLDQTSYFDFSDFEDGPRRARSLAKVFTGMRRTSRESDAASPAAEKGKGRPRSQRLRKSFGEVNETLKSVFQMKK